MMATEASGTLQSGRLASDAAAEASAAIKKGANWQVHYNHCEHSATLQRYCTFALLHPMEGLSDVVWEMHAIYIAR